MSSTKFIKRSKRREHLVDEDSSARAERLMAKRNLDEPAMSSTKSFLPYSDSQIVFNITNLGVSLRNNTNKNVENIKLLECDRLVEASKKDPKIINTNDIEDDDISEKDRSRLEPNHNLTSHDFMSFICAKKATLSLVAAEASYVISTTKGRVDADRIVRMVSFQLARRIFSTDFIILSGQRIDVILRMSWMKLHTAVLNIAVRLV
jgi:hypothetical protein